MRLSPAILIFGLLSLPALTLASETNSPLPMLSDTEQAYYNKAFNYTMDTIVAGGTYDWHSFSGAGEISVSASFLSKSGTTCRNFTEAYSVDEQQGGDGGVACKRVGKDGWCRLMKKEDALTCALEPPSSVFNDKLRDSSEFMSHGGDKMRNAKHSWEDWTPW